MAIAARVARPRGGTHGALWTLWTLCALCAFATACGAPDPLPNRPAEAPPGRLADGLLDRPALQAVVESTVARDGAALIALLGDEDPLVRARAAYGLGSVQDPAARSPLLDLLHDPQPRVREDAAFALGQLERGADVGAAALIADESDARVRRALVEAVGKQGGREAIDALLALADAELLPATTLALSRGVVRQVASEAVMDTLVARMANPDPDVRAAAAYFVARGETTTRWYARLDEITDVLASYRRTDEAAMHVLAGLGRIVSTFAARPVGGPWLATSPDWRIRANAAVELGARSMGTRASEALIRALDDASPHVRLRAAEALATIAGDPDLRARLAARVAADPGDATVAGPLLGLLAMGGDLDAVHAYLDRLPAHDATGWREAVTVLEGLPGPVAVPVLVRVIGQPNAPDAVAADVAATLVEIWAGARDTRGAAEAFLPLVTRAAREAPPARVAVLAWILADEQMLDRGSAEALADLLARLPSGPASEELMRALAESRDTRVRDLVGAFVDEPPAPEDPLAEGAEVDADTLSQADVAEDPTPDPEAAPPVLAVDWPYLQALGPHPRLVLDTERGRVVVVLRTEEAPLTVQAVATLAREGRYDGVPFHRVVPNFVVQGGDVSRGDGSGGPGFVLRSEFTRTPYLRGVAGMASSGKDTEGSQYFVTHSPQWHLDGGWTAFGWVERGMDVVDRIVRGDRVLRAVVVPGR